VLDGEERVINTLGPGSFFGEMALLLAEPRTASIRARQQCDLFALDKADFVRVLHDHPEFAKPLLEACRERYRVTVAID
jgi:CRP-like cAMP-binding protein